MGSCLWLSFSKFKTTDGYGTLRCDACNFSDFRRKSAIRGSGTRLSSVLDDGVDDDDGLDGS